jgi:hypothetical protein
VFGTCIEFDYCVVEFKDGKAEAEKLRDAGFSAGLPAGGEGRIGFGRDASTLPGCSF